MANLELIVIPSPLPSHLTAMLHGTNVLLSRHPRLTATFLIIKPLNDDSFQIVLNSINDAATPRLRFIHLSADDRNGIPAQSLTFLFDYIDSHFDKVREMLADLIEHPVSPGSRLAGIVLDIFTTEFSQLAKAFHVPSYFFGTSSASCLGVDMERASWILDHNQESKRRCNGNSDAELRFRSFSHPLPANVLPPGKHDDPGFRRFCHYISRISETNGILINTFYEFETYAIDSLIHDDTNTRPKVYTIGPITEANCGKGTKDSANETENELMNWLDNQPENSVVFLCFGTSVKFNQVQVKEFAKALEDSGSKFLWSLHVVENKSFEEVLPEGFLERTKGIGKVISWAPQLAVLSHAAVGGFVSHCGWNSVMESVWCGVPVVTLPRFSDQHGNAFLLVVELGIAEAIRINADTAKEVVPAEDIEAAIRRVMAEDGVRGKVKEMQKKSREALEEGGSSYKAQIRFVEDVVKNVE